MDERYYKLLLNHYYNAINNPAWKKTQRIRNYLDKIKNNNKQSEPQTSTNQEQIKQNDFVIFNNLFNEYESIMNSKFWMIGNLLNRKKDVSNFISSSNVDEDYYEWIENNEGKKEDIISFPYNPLISIIVPVYNVDGRILDECVESVFAQKYDNYELILIDDKLSNSSTLNSLNKYVNNNKIKIIRRKDNGGISKATNDGLKVANGEYVAFLDNDDVLASNALYEAIKAINDNRNIEIIYSDEDKITQDSNTRFDPYFKPDYSPELIMYNNYFCHFLVIKKNVCDKAGELCSELDGAQDYDYVLRCIEKVDINNIKHIDKILYHWRAIQGSTALNADAKKGIKEISDNVKKRAIQRRGLDAYVSEDGNIIYNSDNEKISIIIPSKDNFEVLKMCLDSVYQTQNYKNFEIIIVDNGSNDENKYKVEKYISSYSNIKYMYKKMDFNFSAQCNIGVENSTGQYLLFLNDDIEIVNPDTLGMMVGYARQMHIGAVGIKLLFPNSTIIQHCGIVNTFPGPLHYLLYKDDIYVHHFGFNKSVVDVIGVTGACMLMSREKYDSVNGYDDNFNNDYNDVDLCFKLHEKGYYNVSINNLYAYHHESLSRGKSKERELLYTTRELYNKHPKLYLKDPFYNSNYRLSTNDFKY